MVGLILTPISIARYILGFVGPIVAIVCCLPAASFAQQSPAATYLKISPPLELTVLETAARKAIWTADQQIIQLTTITDSPEPVAPALRNAALMLEQSCTLLSFATTNDQQVWRHCDALLLGWIDALSHLLAVRQQTLSSEHYEKTTHDLESTLGHIKIRSSPSRDLANPLWSAATLIHEDYVRLLTTWALRNYVINPDSILGTMQLTMADSYVNNNPVRDTVNVKNYLAHLWGSFRGRPSQDDSALQEQKKAEAALWLDDQLWGVRFGGFTEKPDLWTLTSVARDRLYPPNPPETLFQSPTGTAFFRLELVPTEDPSLIRCAEVMPMLRPDSDSTSVTLVQDQIELPTGNWTVFVPDPVPPKIQVPSGSAQLVSRSIPCSNAPPHIKKTPDVLVGAKLDMGTERFVLQLGPAVTEFGDYTISARLLSMRVSGDFISGDISDIVSIIRVFSTVRVDTDSFIDRFWEAGIGFQAALDWPIYTNTRLFLQGSYSASLRHYDAARGPIGNDVVGWSPIAGVVHVGVDISGVFLDLRGTVSYFPWMTINPPTGETFDASAINWESGGGIGFVGRQWLPSAQFGARLGVGWARYEDTTGPSRFGLSNLRMDTRFVALFDVMPVRVITTAGIDWFGGTPNITGPAFSDKLAALSNVFAPTLHIGIGFAWCAQRCSNTDFPDLSPWEISGGTP